MGFWKRLFKRKDKNPYKSVYQLGYADPCKKIYTTFSGVDAKLWIKRQDGRYIHMPMVQAISFNLDEFASTSIHANHRCTGEITSYLDGDGSLYHMLKEHNFCDLVLHASNEYGQIGVAIIKRFQVNGYSTGVSVDDILVQEQVTFSATDIVPFQKGDGYSPHTLNAILDGKMRKKEDGGVEYVKEEKDVEAS